RALHHPHELQPGAHHARAHHRLRRVHPVLPPGRGRPQLRRARRDRRNGRSLMYAALWRILPGPWWVRVLILLVMLVAVLAALAFWIFPWVQTLIATPEVTVDQ